MASDNPDADDRDADKQEQQRPASRSERSDRQHRERPSSATLTPEQLETIEALSASLTKPEEGRFARFRRLRGREKAVYFRQEFLWPIAGILLAVVLVVSLVTSVVSSKQKKTGLQVVSFADVLGPKQATSLQKTLQAAHLAADPVRVDATYAYSGQTSVKLRIDASSNNLDVVVATAPVMKKLAGLGYLADVHAYAGADAVSAAGVRYAGMRYATGSQTQNKAGKGAVKTYALRLGKSGHPSVRDLRSKDGKNLQIGVFNRPLHAAAVKNLVRWARLG